MNSLASIAAIKTRCCAILLLAASCAIIPVVAAATKTTADYTDTDVANTSTSNKVNDVSFALRSSSRRRRLQQQRRTQENCIGETTPLWSQLGCGDGGDQGGCMACDFLRDRCMEPSSPDHTEEDSFRTGRTTSQVCSNGKVTTSAGVHKCDNVDLQAYLSLEELGSVANNNGIGLNDVWGWTHIQSAREFALVGDMTGTIMVEVTEPTEPVVLGRLDMGIRGSGSYWTDIKTDGHHHAYIVKDYLKEDKGHGIQIFNLNKLLDVKKEDAPVEFSEDGRYKGFDNAHNLAMSEETGILFALGANAASNNGPKTCDGLHILNIKESPTNPEYIGCFDDAGYIHDAQCTRYYGPDENFFGNDICFTFNLPKNQISILDVTDPRNIKKLSTTTVAKSDKIKFAHQGWSTADYTTIIYNHEDKQEGANRAIDVSDLENPTEARELDETTEHSDHIKHNMYTLGPFVYQANYRAGMQIYKITKGGQIGLKEVGYFDTYAKSDGLKYQGAFGVYPYLPSGNVLVSDIESGLFILKPKKEFHVRTMDGVDGCVDDPKFKEKNGNRNCKGVQEAYDNGDAQLCHKLQKDDRKIRDFCPQACKICKRSDEGETAGTPTGTPSGIPTGTPTGKPIGPPTRTPTGAPIGPPTRTPTGAPTPTPTGKPTKVTKACKAVCKDIFKKCVEEAVLEVSNDQCQGNKCKDAKKTKKKLCKKAKKTCKKQC